MLTLLRVRRGIQRNKQKADREREKETDTAGRRETGLSLCSHFLSQLERSKLIFNSYKHNIHPFMKQKHKKSSGFQLLKGEHCKLLFVILSEIRRSVGLGQNKRTLG